MASPVAEGDVTLIRNCCSFGSLLRPRRERESVLRRGLPAGPGASSASLADAGWSRDATAALARILPPGGPGASRRHSRALLRRAQWRAGAPVRTGSWFQCPADRRARPPACSACPAPGSPGRAGRDHGRGRTIAGSGCCLHSQHPDPAGWEPRSGRWAHTLQQQTTSTVTIANERTNDSSAMAKPPANDATHARGPLIKCPYFASAAGRLVATSVQISVSFLPTSGALTPPTL
jgi:hypothetical protein